MSTRSTDTGRRPSVKEALGGMVFVVLIIVGTASFRVGMQAPLVLGSMAAGIAALFLGYRWDDVQRGMIEGITPCLGAVAIMTLVGMLTGLWIAGGTVPAIIVYGLRSITPQAFLPITFLLCILTSTATGTSFGTVGTMGLALMGVGSGLGVPAPLTAGAIASGAFFGDKMSPLSDTTNVAPVMAGTDLYSHIGSMMWTTLPAALISIGIYAFWGRNFGGGNFDPNAIAPIISALEAKYAITPWALAPALLVIGLSLMRVPAVATMSLGVLFSGGWAFFTQGTGLKALLAASMHGIASDTGIALVDKILSRGGIDMMSGTILLLLAATAMGGILERCGVLDVLVNALLEHLRTARGAILATLASCYLTLAVTGNMMLGIILPGRAFKPVFDRLGIEGRVLSRTLEDASTLGSVIVPWGIPAVFLMGVLGVDSTYIPYTFLSFLTPIFAIFYAITGIAVWKKAPTVLPCADTPPESA